MKKILVINANPKTSSLCKGISEVFAQKSSERHHVEVIHIGDMNFNMSLDEGFDREMELEDDLKRFQQLLIWSEHVVIVSPVWWGSMPAKFKALIDRAFLSGFAFKYHEGKSIPEKLLKGRTSQLIITLDTPPWWYKWLQGNPIYKQLKHTILDFSGIKNQSTAYWGPIIGSDARQREKWLDKARGLASAI